ncbi:efflux RND transporter periplasmic adaptor subunit [Bacillus sp. V3B]|uniref:efflux RND transporter periplasmic adaptor subunit n=1 Tax=Bacillus sp. V3B TaxID=2804915 RepID=UPI00210EA8DA|nr:efflux RND transporter periplasmic adaptor subunit [Bacillus sp. V3B]MCQ6277177.1 efflux RND transporter periplasmic adaptor subunit [Bacillus sp. V3B]
MKKQTKIMIVALGITVSILFTFFSFENKNSDPLTVDTTALSTKEIINTVTLPGRLSFSSEQRVFYNESIGTIKEVHVNEGDDIKKGDPLITYENKQLSLEKEQLELTIQENYLRINQIEKQIENYYKKQKELKKENVSTLQKLQSQEELDQLQMAKRIENIALKRNLLSKETIEADLNQLILSSNMDGQIVTVNDNDPLLLNTNTPLIHIVDTANYYIKGLISEYEVLKVQKGQHVNIKSEVVRGRTWSGTVTDIGLFSEENSEASGQNGLVYYPVTVSINEPNIKAKPGFNLVMDIETSKDTVNSLPLEAVKQDERNHFVYVVQDNKAVKRDVQVGKFNEKYIEIVEGIQKEDLIVINPPKDLQKGMEVKLKND